MEARHTDRQTSDIKIGRGVEDYGCVEGDLSSTNRHTDRGMEARQTDRQTSKGVKDD